MDDLFIRTRKLLGREAMEKLSSARVAVFGVGGVGGYVVEGLARSGVGTLHLIDDDVIAPSNVNRQIIATTQNIGEAKVEAAKKRVLTINPAANVISHKTFFTPETAKDFDFTQFDYVVDAIDTVTGKIELVLQAQAANVPIICSMGAGNKLDPTAFKVADLYSTKVDPLARVMRTELKKRGVKKLKVVYSEELPILPKEEIASENGRHPPASCAFIPSVVGLIIAGEVVKELSKVTFERKR